jgi:rod shape determining protein RodA
MHASPFGTSIKDFHEDDRPRTPSTLSLLDPLLLLAVAGLVVFSVYTIAGATADDIPGDPYHYLIRQSIYAVIGFVLMLVVARFDYSRLRELRLGLYAAMVGLIGLVLIVGGATRGSRRWIELPFFTFQPSEFGKVLLILALSAFIIDRSRRLSDRETTSRIMLLALLPAALVVVQPDLGTSMVYIVIALALLFVAGTKWTHFAALGGISVIAVTVALVVAPAIGVSLLKPYQLDRLTVFINPSDHPRDEGYQLAQSINAIGSGQKTGRGAEAATQTKLDFLPEHHTDFVFSVVGEQFGFVGAAVLLSLYALLIWRSLRILTMAKNLYGALIAGGIVAMLMFQLFVNVGMTVGIMPVTGVTLPLMSYGGASVITTFLALGLLQSIHVQARATALAKGRETFA